MLDADDRRGILPGDIAAPIDLLDHFAEHRRAIAAAALRLPGLDRRAAMAKNQFRRSQPRGDQLLAKYELTPNPTFKATSRLTSIFPKVHGYVWIDENSGELARIEGDVTGDMSIGLFLGRIYKGSHFMQERYEVLPGLWQPTFTQYDFDGRKLFSGFSVHERTFYSNYRYIGPPKDAREVIRKELAHADLNKTDSTAADP